METMCPFFMKPLKLKSDRPSSMRHMMYPTISPSTLGHYEGFWKTVVEVHEEVVAVVFWEAGAVYVHDPAAGSLGVNFLRVKVCCKGFPPYAFRGMSVYN